MQQTVKIYKYHNKIKVKFMFNTDLLDIMREYQGWYFKKERAWIFPLSKLSKLRDRLVKEMYNVDIISAEVKKPKLDKVFEDKDVVQVWGICKKCKREAFVNRKRLCNQCT